MASQNAAVIEFELTAPVYLGRSLTPAQAARMAANRVTASTIRQWCDEGRFRCAKFGGRWLIDREGWLAFLSGQGFQGCLEREAPNAPNAPNAANTLNELGA